MLYRNKNGNIIADNIKKYKFDNGDTVFNPKELNFNKYGYKVLIKEEPPEFNSSTHTLVSKYVETPTSWRITYSLRELTEEEKSLMSEV